MEKLSQLFKGLIEKVKKLSKMYKIALGLLIVSIIAIIFTLLYVSSANKYDLLFNFQNAEDGKPVIEKLQAQKIDMKVQGNAIYVPKEKAAELRMSMASDLSSSSAGWEIFDGISPLGITDEQFAITKQRAIQGELEKTIKAFEQIQNARVLLTMPRDSVFVKDATPGKASVYLKLKTGAKLTTEQVKAIVAIVSGSVQNMPKENIEVVDDKMNLLSKDISADNNQAVSQATLDTQAKTEADFEKKLEKALLDILQPTIGKDKVNVKVNADLDFDSKQKSTLTYDPNKVELSSHTVKESTSTPSGPTTQSPVDNNMNNTIAAGTTSNATTTKEDFTVNHNVGHTETKTINAPGEIKRLTSTVMIDGQLDAATKAEIEKAVAGVIGFKADRGDSISVVGMTFDTSAKDAYNAAQAEIQKQIDQEQKMKLYRYAAIGGSVLFVLLLFMLTLLAKKLAKRRAAARALRAAREKEALELAGTGIDVVIDDDVPHKEKIEFEPLDFEVNDEQTHIENEVKKYAINKPEQVADIIKSWMSEDER
jgi:flagellar M-ring protein FliF